MTHRMVPSIYGIHYFEAPVFDDEVREKVTLERPGHINEGEVFRNFSWPAPEDSPALPCSLTIEDLNHLINGGMLSIEVQEFTCVVYLHKDTLAELRKGNE